MNKALLSSSLVALLVALASPASQASTIFGMLDNFDVVNNTGSEMEGFEIELEGVHVEDITRTFSDPYIRYTTPALVSYDNTATGGTYGVYVRYMGAWDSTNQSFLQATPMAAAGYVPSGESCWTYGLGTGYAGSGCEHFGVSLNTQPTNTSYHWLNGDAATGTFSIFGSGIALPTPTWTVTPPAVPGGAPVVAAAFEIPNPEGAAYGDAYWVKIFKNESQGPIELNNLLRGDALIAGAAIEIEWELLQAKPGQGLVLNEGEIGDGVEAVVRSYEFYAYNKAWGLSNGYVDPVNGEVMECVLDGCNDPTADELGNFIGRQMVGINLAAPVPEASMSAMMLVGLGFVAMRLHHRQA